MVEAMSLDVVNFYRGLSEAFPSSMWLSTEDQTKTVTLVGSDGTPMQSGWFNHSAQTGLAYPIPDAYAFSVIPDNATSPYHTLRLAQQTPGGSVELTEEDHRPYIERGDPPTLLARRILAQPMLGELIANYALEGVALDPQYGSELWQARLLGLQGLRRHGRVLREAQAGLGTINSSFLSYCSRLSNE